MATTFYQPLLPPEPLSASTVWGIIISNGGLGPFWITTMISDEHGSSRIASQPGPARLCQPPRLASPGWLPTEPSRLARPAPAGLVFVIVSIGAG